ncbi:MAG TPA: saccharopine dehydrogenase NADP-binding domain-containing protein [Streptosporangiaceae bacterium]|nr:saccharopine dehydrogenase NADP-binding domain-containing protein [Streptosporangiaceae bacterium]
MDAERELDVVVFGATGFVGRLVAAYLAEHAPEGVRIGLAGRSQARLEETRADLGPVAADWPLIVADSGDAASLATLARSARVVATTVGPYRPRGLPLVGACAEAGTDYVDLSGEVLFERDSIERYHEVAAQTGARIVHGGGFDSIPSDLGVHFLHETVQTDGGGKLEDTTLVVTRLRGGFSGGTLASIVEQLDEVRADPALRRTAADPYALSPDRPAEPDLGRQRDLMKVRHDHDLGIWTGPFLMASINTRVVRRSNSLLDWAYGRQFRYREVSGYGTGRAGALRAGVATAAMGALAGALAYPRARRLLVGRVLPGPGQGPREQTRRNGRFRMEIYTRTSAERRYRARVAAQGDPGYQATAVMMGETALALVLDRDRLPGRAGVLTPATALGTVLTDRLRAAGMTFEATRADGD